MPIHLKDCVEGLKELETESAQIVIADPPYNIGKDFGNTSDKQTLPDYLTWCDEWIAESLRVLKHDGTLYIYGFSEILAHISVRLTCNKRWLVWHYTNKTKPKYNFWQRTHEAILVCWKCPATPHFNVDDVREPYTTGNINRSGRPRASTSNGWLHFKDPDTPATYNAHPKGAMPRDVIKCPTLSGGAGQKERIKEHPTQKPLALCERLIKAARKTPDDLVVIPFAGSGSEAVACKKLGLNNFVGFEINPRYVEIANDRLAS